MGVLHNVIRRHLGGMETRLKMPSGSEWYKKRWKPHPDPDVEAEMEFRCRVAWIEAASSYSQWRREHDELYGS